ncbi:amidase family protein [Streptomyces sp. NPDC026206]|uniref:amidase family protein n=1 Tax=Streptomyces sp. NPDC026206 TaxID=3157089 RepID=UPI0033F9ECF1
MLLDRIERHDKALGLVVTLDERALSRAAEADEATVRGGPLGPFHGVSMTVKDCFATAGLRTTGGAEALASYVPRQDADVVAAARRAGCIVFGKTNLPRNSTDVQAYNDLFGVARNPWRPEFSPGGSSGGAAGAVAAGFSPLELGSDVAGSIRIPAAHCGVFAHKPSFGVVPAYGHVPPLPFAHTTSDITAVGPFARSVADLEQLLEAVAGPHSWDSAAWRLTLPPARPVRRVAAWFDDPYCPVDAEVQRALRYAAGLLSDSGVLVEEAAPPGIRLEASDRVFRRLLAPVAYGDYSARRIEDIADGSGQAGSELGAGHVAQSHRAWAEAGEQRARMRLLWQSFFAGHDAILLPVAPTTAIPHDHRPFPERRIVVGGEERPYWDQIVWAGLTGVSYLPTTVVPVCRDSRGLPVGIAVCGPYLADRTTLALAGALARLLPPLGRPPSPTPSLAGADARTP